MKPTNSKSPPGVSAVVVIPDAAIAALLEAMKQLLLNKAPAEADFALTEHLDRKNLDFSLTSLHEIDRYLICVHDRAHEVSGLPLLSTILTIAMYVGEIIRREAPAKRYEWVSVGESSGSTGETTIAYPDFGAVRALRARDGDMCMPSRAVLRVILRGSKARSIQSFARGAMGVADLVSKPADTRVREP